VSSAAFRLESFEFLVFLLFPDCGPLLGFPFFIFLSGFSVRSVLGLRYVSSVFYIVFVRRLLHFYHRRPSFLYADGIEIGALKTALLQPAMQDCFSSLSVHSSVAISTSFLSSARFFCFLEICGVDRNNVHVDSTTLFAKPISFHAHTLSLM
jgi:hypothetical protein